MDLRRCTVSLFARVQSLQALQKHHLSLSITTHSVFFVYRKHKQVCNKLHLIKLKTTNRWQFSNKQNCGPQDRHHIHPTYAASAGPPQNGSVTLHLQNTYRKMSFTSHTACVCVVVSTSAFTSHLISDCFQCPPTYATLSVDKKNIYPSDFLSVCGTKHA